MTLQGDPYRTLGVAPGASLNEIKSAYRRLAKQYHPDTAGERALSRFLAIQAAYERLVDGEGHLRPAAAESWPADAARPRASRDAWRARRSNGGSTPGRGSGAPGASEPAAGRGDRNGRGPDPRARSGAGEGAGGPDRASPRRGPRRATPGSTTYDEATEAPLDLEWEGGAWYGPSSGTYWTLNPREYADPRKHGPEYLARARRAAADARAAADPGSGAVEDPEARDDPVAEPPAEDETVRRAT